MMPRSEVPEPALRDYLRVVRRRKALVLAGVVLGVVIGLGLSLSRDPLYKGTARLLLQPADAERVFDAPVGGRFGDPARALETELDLIKYLAPPASIKGATSRIADVSATAADNTDIIKVGVTAEDPELAARAANAYARAYVELRRQRTVRSLEAAARQLELRVTELDPQIAALSAPDAAPPDQQRRELLVSRQSALRQKLDEVQVEAALTTGGVQLAAPASVPTERSSPRPARDGALGASLGLVVGLAIAFVREQFDDRIASTEDLHLLLGNLPLLAKVPVTPSKRRRPGPVMLADPDHWAAESYRSLRTSLQYQGLGEKVKVLQITSPGVGEGKTTILANLAVALTQAGVEVLIACCDLRRPSVHRLFGLDNEVGFTTVAKDGARLEDSVQHVPGNLPLAVLPSGEPTANPSEILSRSAAERLFAGVRDMAEVVLVDSPPLLAVTDASVLVKHVDATLLVISAGMTRRRHLKRAIEMLEQIDATIIGVVFNRSADDGGYGEYRYYAPRGSRSKRTSGRKRQGSSI